jgi:metallo-beta-lactamase family protein
MNSEHPFSIKFLGAAGTVTGSKFLLGIEDKKILVDCGLFQGLKQLRELNWLDFPIPAKELDCIILTHGHLDHIGYLPRLVKQGFSGPVYCTEPTADLAEIVLKDSAKIQEEEAEHANEFGYSKHSPALPLYELKDVENAIPLLKPHKEDEFIEAGNDIRFRFKGNAHIPGAAFIEMNAGGDRILFSGDLGRPGDPMLQSPDKPEHADYVLVESTYGDRNHPADSPEEILLQIIQKSLSNHGPLIVPSFTVDRAQDFMYLIWKLKQENKIPDIPVYLDSPMGIDVSKLFLKYPECLKIGMDVFTEVFKSTRMVTSIEETRHLAKNKHPKIIIAGSGMMNGGRILTYLEEQLENPNATIIIPGYQAAGTRGRTISEGGNEIKIRGNYYKVKACIEHIHTMSSHAGQDEILGWLSAIKNTPKQIFIVHGEPQSANALHLKIKKTMGWTCTVPQLMDTFNLKQ